MPQQPTNPHFTWSDAWLLLAIAHASGVNSPDGPRGARLTEVIAAGDALQHAIFTNAELRRGAAKLLASGYIRFENGLWSLTPKMVRQYQRLTAGFTAMLDSQRALERFLDAAPYPAGDPDFEDPAWPLPTLSNRAISDAAAEWDAEGQEIIRGLLKNDPGT